MVRHIYLVCGKGIPLHHLKSHSRQKHGIRSTLDSLHEYKHSTGFHTSSHKKSGIKHSHEEHKEHHGKRLKPLKIKL